MRMPINLMMAIGKAALNLAGLGLVGDAVEIARAAWEDWKTSPEERLEELEAVLQADDEEIARGVADVVAEIAGGEPEPVRMRLATFLKQFPSQARRSQRRPSDPSGRSICPGLSLERSEDLVPFIPEPERLPRFQAGDRPPGVGDWVLTELLGIGGFGEVWKARNAHFESLAPVALKFCTDLQAREILLRHEAKVLDRVMRQGRHPGIVRLEATFLSADPPCLQYEFVDGGDLGGLILNWHRQMDRPTPAQVAESVLQIAEIVAVAHRLDPPIVHRDLKPANILVQRSGGRVAFKITDFGIGGIATARAIQATRQATSPSQFLATAVRGSGTWLYASPEQLRGEPPDPRDDVHALGVIWYQMLTGDMVRGRPGGSIWRRGLIDRGMPVEMLDLLELCFEEQEHRPPDASALAVRLREILKRPIETTEQAKEEPKPETVRPTPKPSPAPVRKRKTPTKAVQQVVTPVEPSPALASKPPQEFVNSIGIKFKLIPAGEFEMGSPDNETSAFPDEKPRHQVIISKPFYLGVYPVTQGEYVQVTQKENPSHFKGNDRLPVERATWFDAVEFCNALSRQEGLPPFYKVNGQTVEVSDWNGTGYRLPTEAEWEYACRAGNPAPYSFGDKNLLDQYAWYNANSGGETHPVGEKKPNAWDLYDMHGNVWEWCWDWSGADYYKQFKQSPAVDPRGAEQASGRVRRGGGWRSDLRRVRSACRHGGAPVYQRIYLGFRVARVQSGQEPAEPVQPKPAESVQPKPAEPVRRFDWVKKLFYGAREPVQPEPAEQVRPKPVKVSKPPELIEKPIYMKLIPAGEFEMGSPDNEAGAYLAEMPRHSVKISKPFYLGVYPVTQGEYVQVTKKENPTYFKGNDRLPVESVSWFDAVEFCNALSRQEGLPPFYKVNGQTVEVSDWNGTGYRLPTEAEWEYACRAGNPAPYSFGDKNLLDQYAWYNANSDGETHPVGQKKPNAWDLYDMHGNVWEYCWDRFDDDYYKQFKQSTAIDPRGAERARSRVIRGGSWGNGRRACGRHPGPGAVRGSKTEAAWASASPEFSPVIERVGESRPTSEGKDRKELRTSACSGTRGPRQDRRSDANRGRLGPTTDV